MLKICIFLWRVWNESNKESNLFIIKFAEPMFSCVLGALLLNENIFKWQYLVAFLLIATGIVISNLKGKKTEKKAENQAENQAQEKE